LGFQLGQKQCDKGRPKGVLDLKLDFGKKKADGISDAVRRLIL
jgi:hypothetical protein